MNIPLHDIKPLVEMQGGWNDLFFLCGIIMGILLFFLRNYKRKIANFDYKKAFLSQCAITKNDYYQLSFYGYYAKTRATESYFEAMERELARFKYHDYELPLDSCAQEAVNQYKEALRRGE